MIMKIFKMLIGALCLVVGGTLMTNAQTKENVTIQGDHGMLDAVVQKPKGRARLLSDCTDSSYLRDCLAV